MMFYYLSKGKSQGPINETQLKQMISEKKFGPFDLVFINGTEKWQTVKSVPQFANSFKAVSESLNTEKVWVVLKHVRLPEGIKTKQDGPFNIDEVKTKLRKGDLSFDDYIWTDGMADWYRLGHLEDFSLVERKSVDVSDLTDPSIRLGERAAIPSDGNKPVRVLRLKKVKPVVKVSESVPVDSQVTITSSKTFTKTGSIAGAGATAKKRPAAKKRFGLAESLFVFLVFTGGVASTWLFYTAGVQTRIEKFRIKPTAASPIANDSNRSANNDMRAENEVSVSEPVVTNGVNEEIINEVAMATLAKISVVGLAPQQKLKLSGNGAFPSYVKVKITANAGDLIGQPRFEKVTRLLVLNDQTVSLAALGLPMGRYTFQLIEPAIGEEFVALFGVKSMDRFRTQLNTYRKQIVAKHLSEKLTLGSLLEDISSLKNSPRASIKLRALAKAKKGRVRLHEPIWRRIEGLASNALTRNVPQGQFNSEVEQLIAEIQKVTIFNRL
jgi:hypothetical protein